MTATRLNLQPATKQNPLAGLGTLGLLTLVACPAVFACWHLRQLRTEADAPLAAAAIAALQNKVQIVHLGDVNHRRNERLMQWLAKRDNLQRVKQAGVTTLCLESSTNLQLLATFVMQGQLSPEAYARKAVSLGFVKAAGHSLRSFLIEGRTLRTASKLGLQVHLSDPGNGDAEMRTYQRAKQKARLNGSLENFGPEGEPDKRWPKLTQLERDELGKLQAAWRQARTNDTALAKHLAGLATKGQRILLVYGSGHGAGAHDLNELLAEMDIKLVRIDVYPDRQELAEHTTAAADPPVGDYIFSEKRYFPRSTPRPVPPSTTLAPNSTP